MNVIIREQYLKKIRPYINKGLIKVITGQRRTGKSYLLKMIAIEIEKDNPGANIIFVDKEKFEFDSITNYSQLVSYIDVNKHAGMNYIFVDEIQEIESFEKALRSLISEENIDIYCTGSNSKVFSGELASALSGRQIEIRMHSLSFKEFLEFHQLEQNEETLMKFIKYGGMPFLIHLELNDEMVFDYLKNIYATILYRDIISRYEVRDSFFLDNLLRYIADTTGSIISANKIANYLKSQNIGKATSVIINYLNYMQEAYFINRLKRIEVNGKKIFELGEKYFFEDIGLRNAIIGFKPMDISKVIENIVYNQLSYWGYDVFIGRLGEKEVDFVGRRNSEYVYVQVAYLLSSDEVIAREFGNLLAIEDNYPKYVVSLDSFPAITSYKGIKHLHLIKFLTINEL